MALPSALILIGALWLAAGWDARTRGELSLTARLKRLTDAPDDGVARFDMAPLVALTIRFAALCLATVGVAAFLVVPAQSDDFQSLWNYAGWALLFLSSTLGVPALWRIKSARGRVFALLLMQRLAWSFALSLSLCWLALTLATAPAHKRFEAEIDRTLQIGQFQLARQRLGFRVVRKARNRTRTESRVAYFEE